MDNIHKTYLLGIEGVPALRYAFYAILRHLTSFIPQNNFVPISKSNRRSSSQNFAFTSGGTILNPDFRVKSLFELFLHSIGVVIRRFGGTEQS
jgi:hypothetical protein